MNFLDKITLRSYKTGSELGFGNLVQQKLKLIAYTVSYVQDKRDDEIFKKHKSEVIGLANVKPINWQNQKVAGFNNLEKNELINVSLKSLKYLPSKIPIWMFSLDLAGVWWFINIQKDNAPLSRGQCIDIYESLSKLDFIVRNDKKRDIMEKNINDNWFCAMKNFFKGVVDNGDKVMFFVKKVK